jgi:DNA (cytosine-5)-methyltransferase 1
MTLVEPGVVVELFAGVGGFRLGLEDESADWKVKFSNQWEPGKKSQDASDCYTYNFGEEGHVCEDINKYLDWVIDKTDCIPDKSKIKLPKKIDLLVGGFPCQDYSVAKSLSYSDGIEGKKGVLWWDINRLIKHKKPKYVLLENVDRLLVSPSNKRGRDFAVMLTCLSKLGYIVSWRVINSAEYGHPQRRKRVYILAEKSNRKKIKKGEVKDLLTKNSLFAKAFPVTNKLDKIQELTLGLDPVYVSDNFHTKFPKNRWENSGIMVKGVAYTAKLESNYTGPKRNLGSILQKNKVDSSFYIDDSQLGQWRYLKGSKKEKRIDKKTGFKYSYSEGSMAFPDSIKNPSRTILTGEGGSSPSRFKHVIKTKYGKYRRLTPVELERLQEFPDNWTKYSKPGVELSDTKRAFFMGNALVVGVIRSIGVELAYYRKTHKTIF